MGNQRKHARPADPDEVLLAELALQQLKVEYLAVSLAPAPRKLTHDGQKIRVVDNRNPEWFRGMCEGLPNSKHLRQYVTRALKRVASGWVDPSPWSLAEEVLDVLWESQAEEWGLLDERPS